MQIARLAVFGFLCLGLYLGRGVPCCAQQESDDGVFDMVVSLLGDEDKEMRSVGLEQVRTGLKGRAATERLAELLPKLSPDAQAGLISALADRGDVAACPAIRALLAAASEASVRVAVVTALGYLGDATDSKLLMHLLTDGSPAEQKAARASLLRLQDGEVVAAMIAELRNAAPPLRIALIEILGQRRALDAMPKFLAAAVDDNASVRVAAMKTLGQLAGPAQVAGMVRGVLRAEPGRERDDAEKAVAAVCARGGDADQQAAPLLAAYAALNAGEQAALLPLLGRVGGRDSLKIIERAIDADAPERYELGIRAICNWPNVSVAPRLIELATADKHAAHRTAALRALIRVAPLQDDRTDTQRLELLAKAMSMATRDAERLLVLDRARTIRSIEALHFIIPYLDQPEFTQQACLSVVELAHHRGLREPNKKEFDQVLDRVIAISKDPVVVDRAQRYKKGQTWERPSKPAARPASTATAATPKKSKTREDKPHSAAPGKPTAKPVAQFSPDWTMVIILGSVCLLVLLVLVRLATRR